MRGPHAINLSWLLRLRWGAEVGQALLVLVAHFGLGLPQALGPLLTTIFVGAASNGAVALWSRRAREVREWTVWAVLALDVVLLTVLLDLSGGPFNPFAALYLVHIALAAVVLRERWTWALLGLMAVCLGVLFVRYLWLPYGGVGRRRHIHDVRLHLQGMWAAFGMAAGFIVYFVQRVTKALARREEELVAIRAETARNEKLAALATLAAGAAHELSTPLSTIAVVAKELERRKELGAESREDAQLIRQQVARCREILAQMGSHAGASHGETLVPVVPAALVAEALSGLRGGERVKVEADAAAGEVSVVVPAQALTHAVRGVVKNALQASGDGAAVRVEVRREAAGWRLAVHDAGAGMPEEVLARAGEPFFTTKAPGEGMGLGLYLTRAVVEQMGGKLALTSRAGEGTSVVLTWPEGALRQSVPFSSSEGGGKPPRVT